MQLRARSVETLPSKLSGRPILLVEWTVGYWHARLGPRVFANGPDKDVVLNSINALEAALGRSAAPCKNW